MTYEKREALEEQQRQFNQWWESLSHEERMEYMAQQQLNGQLQVDQIQSQILQNKQAINARLASIQYNQISDSNGKY